MRNYRCEICKDPAQVIVTVKVIGKRKQLSQRRCVDCAHDVCVVGKKDLKLLRLR